MSVLTYAPDERRPPQRTPKLSPLGLQLLAEFETAVAEHARAEAVGDEHGVIMAKVRLDLARLSHTTWIEQQVGGARAAVKGLLEHAVYDREKNDETISAVAAAESVIADV